jgi:phosphatidylglycerophosphate synthase
MANAITLSRIPLLALILWLLQLPSPTPRFIAVPLTVILILMDTFDGLVARARGEVDVLGSVLDIAADRTVEYVLWVYLSHLGLIPVVIPIVVLARGTFVDAVRSVAASRDVAPFEMMRTSLGRFLVKSGWMRTSYAVVKAVAFVSLALSHALMTSGYPLGETLLLPSQIVAWIALGFCLARGIPVLIEAPRFLAKEDEEASGAA